MPIYEYHCSDCRRCSALLIRTREEAERPACSYCGSTEVQRIMSRFAAVKSEESRLESLSDPSHWSGVDENDPAGVARFVKRMGSDLGEDLSREELVHMAVEAAHEAESGAGADEDAP